MEKFALRDLSFQTPSAPGPAQPTQPGYPASRRSRTCSANSSNVPSGTQQVWSAGSSPPIWNRPATPSSPSEIVGRLIREGILSAMACTILCAFAKFSRDTCRAHPSALRNLRAASRRDCQRSSPMSIFQWHVRARLEGCAARRMY